MCVLAVVVKKNPKNSQPKQIDINYAAEKKRRSGGLSVGWQLIFNRLDCFPSRRAGPATHEKSIGTLVKKTRSDGIYYAT